MNELTLDREDIVAMIEHRVSAYPSLAVFNELRLFAATLVDEIQRGEHEGRPWEVLGGVPSGQEES